MNKYSPTTPLIDEDGEVRELTAEDLAQFKPAHEVLPMHIHAMLGIKPRGKQVAPTKVSTTIRFDADVLSALKSTGKGWQTRVNDEMRAHVRRRKLVAA
jgi:uncharacterized protein (DUF4415 family)